LEEGITISRMRHCNTNTIIDGVKPGLRQRIRRALIRRQPSPSPSLSGESELESPGAPAKSVVFIPLSPQSSRTLARHRQEQEKRAAEGEEAGQAKEDEMPVLSDQQLASIRPSLFRRRSSDPSSNRPIIQRRRARGNNNPLSDADSDVEILPDRFDSQGRPIGRSRGDGAAWNERHGTFDFYPRNRGDKDWGMTGAWSVGGTDSESVEKIVRDVEGVLQGKSGSWGGLIRDVLGSGLAGLSGGRERGYIEDVDDREKLDRRRKRRHHQHYDD
jgi:hypothetical protein